jgi:L-lactate dehydrogenase
MEIQNTSLRKVVIVGAGDVGSTHAFALAQSGIADEIVLIDKNEDLARGQVLDLVHGQAFFPTVSIKVGGARDYDDANVIVITAGAAQKPGETRLNLLRKNAGIVRSVMDDIVREKSRAVVIVVTNPVDVLTYCALRHSGWPKSRVIGSGTVLDSARLRYFLSSYYTTDVHSVHAYVLGEHGDSEVAAWSMTNVSGIPVEEYHPIRKQEDDWNKIREEMEANVRDSAYHIIDYKGATSYAVALSLVRIVGAILRGQNSVLTVSTLVEGEFGLNDVCLSLPCMVSKEGAHTVLEGNLSNDELKALKASAAVLKRAIRDMESG